MSGPPAAAEPAAVDADQEQRRVLAASAVMAAGTVFSRLSGFVRSVLLAAALGAALHADLFTIANTVPNMLYILLAGGVFNAVLVPQLVRAMRHDADGGEAYTNRVVTAAALFLAGVTVVLVVAAPLLMSVLLDERFAGPDLAAERESAVAFARYCLPQVFFYGMFVLVGQILNSRGRFGPMMWAPIANNVISVAVLALYLALHGPATPAEQTGAFTPDQELLLGVGSTVGIAAQLLILLPFVRAAGFRYRPRFDLRGTGLGHTLRLGVWTVLFVVVNQAAYVVVVRLASGGTAAGGDGTGITIYTNAFLIVMVPHAIVTVSLATAILPRLSASAAAGDLAATARSLSSTLRTALVVVVPFAAVLPIVAAELAEAVWGHGATATTWPRYVPTLSLFGAGLVFFTVHYLVLRGFYAVEQTRTVFFIQCAVSGTNIAAALALVRLVDADRTSPALVVAYTAAYLVGSVVSFSVLGRRFGPGSLQVPALLGFLARLLPVVALATAAAFGAERLFEDVVGGDGSGVAAVRGLVVVAVDGVVLLVLAQLVGLRELTAVTDLVRRRLPGRAGRGRRRGGAHRAGR